MANQVRCYVFIESNNVPVRGAIVSAQRCSDGCVRLARTDIFGTAVFNLPNGNYLFRCECVPNFLLPSTAEYCVTLSPVYCSADLLFPCRFVTSNTSPLNINNNVTTNTQQFAQNMGLSPSNTLSNSFFGPNPGFLPDEAPQTVQNPTPSQGVQIGPNVSPLSQIAQRDPSWGAQTDGLRPLAAETQKYSIPNSPQVPPRTQQSNLSGSSHQSDRSRSFEENQSSINSAQSSKPITRASTDRTGVASAKPLSQSTQKSETDFKPKDFM